MKKENQEKQKIVVVLGSTATGKSDVAVKLAKKFNGEIISADSRQVYRGMDIGTGKITKREMNKVAHHLLDVTSPKNVFTASDFKKLAEKKIIDITKRGKLPILVGGTGFYIDSVLGNVSLPEVIPNMKLRKVLEKLTTEKLFNKLQKKDPRRAKNIDKNNRHRLVRAIEIVEHLGSVPKIKKVKSKYNVLKIGITLPDKVLKGKIYKRLIARIKAGMVAEAKTLHRKGVSWNRMNSLGLECRYLSLYLKGILTKEEMVYELNKAIWRYAKRQKTYFKKDKKTKWFSLKEQGKIDIEVKNFLNI